MKSQYKFDTIYLIIGADNLVDFHLWKNIDNILENKVIVINRDNIDVKKYIDNFKNKDNFIVVNDFKCIDISSTNIRVDLITNKDSVDKCVYDYIVKNKLYK